MNQYPVFEKLFYKNAIKPKIREPLAIFRKAFTPPHPQAKIWAAPSSGFLTRAHLWLDLKAKMIRFAFLGKKIALKIVYRHFPLIKKPWLSIPVKYFGFEWVEENFDLPSNSTKFLVVPLKSIRTKSVLEKCVNEKNYIWNQFILHQ
jgi:hypothetical protein